jgi:hypothetical protein
MTLPDNMLLRDGTEGHDFARPVNCKTNSVKIKTGGVATGREGERAVDGNLVAWCTAHYAKSVILQLAAVSQQYEKFLFQQSRKFLLKSVKLAG